MPADTGFRARILTIPHSAQRYDTVGDWQFELDDQPFEPDGTLTVRVSRTADWRYAALVAVHELIEAILCKHRKIAETAVDDWDYAHRDSSDPGAELGCPYRFEHMFATEIEQALARELEVDWRAYERALAEIE